MHLLQDLLVHPPGLCRCDDLFAAAVFRRWLAEDKAFGLQALQQPGYGRMCEVKLFFHVPRINVFFLMMAEISQYKSLGTGQFQRGNAARHILRHQLGNGLDLEAQKTPAVQLHVNAPFRMKYKKLYN